LVTNANDDAVSIKLNHEPNLAGSIGKLGRIAEQIANDLRQSHEVAINNDGLRRTSDHERMATGIDG
jgi:hypothetical protein